VGDTVNGLRVSRIDEKGVTLAGEGGVTETLMVNPSVIKQKRAAQPARINHGERP
jgi:hypothetical protein